MKHLKEFLLENFKSFYNRANTYDINYPGKDSSNGWKLSIVGKSDSDVQFLYDKLHKWLSLKDIAHKFATSKRVQHKDYEQSKKLVTIYVPNDMDVKDLALKVESLIKGYKGWQGIKLPFRGYEHFSNGIFFRNDRNADGEYIPAKEVIVESFLYEAFEIFETREGDQILVPRFKPKKQTHRIFKDWPVDKKFEYKQALMYDAIQWGMILDIVYEKDGVETKRTIQPMVLGRNKDGGELLRAFHLSGDSQSLGKNTKKVWRLFKPDRIIEIKFSGRFFRTAEKNYKANDSAMKGGIIAAADINQIRANQENLVQEALNHRLMD